MSTDLDRASTPATTPGSNETVECRTQARRSWRLSPATSPCEHTPGGADCEPVLGRVRPRTTPPTGCARRPSTITAASALDPRRSAGVAVDVDSPEAGFDGVYGRLRRSLAVDFNDGADDFDDGVPVELQRRSTSTTAFKRRSTSTSASKPRSTSTTVFRSTSNAVRSTSTMVRTTALEDDFSRVRPTPHSAPSPHGSRCARLQPVDSRGCFQPRGRRTTRPKRCRLAVRSRPSVYRTPAFHDRTPAFHDRTPAFQDARVRRPEQDACLERPLISHRLHDRTCAHNGPSSAPESRASAAIPGPRDRGSRDRCVIPMRTWGRLDQGALEPYFVLYSFR